jgi:hypothetical protein
MSHSLRCRCGRVKGVIADEVRANHVLCYCKDCQAFAHFLGRASDVLDERGGSDIVQILPKNLTFTQGVDALACMRLTEKGLLRWYASCCQTPIGNTLATPKLSFIGLVHSCLENPAAFGPVRVVVNTRSAKGEPKPKQEGVGTMLAWFFGNVLKARFTGEYKRTPLFRADGMPIVAPQALSSEEHARLMRAVLA